MCMHVVDVRLGMQGQLLFVMVLVAVPVSYLPVRTFVIVQRHLDEWSS